MSDLCVGIPVSPRKRYMASIDATAGQGPLHESRVTNHCISVTMYRLRSKARTSLCYGVLFHARQRLSLSTGSHVDHVPVSKGDHLWRVVSLLFELDVRRHRFAFACGVLCRRPCACRYGTYNNILPHHLHPQQILRSRDDRTDFWLFPLFRHLDFARGPHHGFNLALFELSLIHI